MARYFQESLSIILLSLAVNLVSEFIGWVMIYSKPEYKNTKRELTRVTKELKRKQDAIVSVTEEKKQEKIIQKLKDEQTHVANESESYGNVIPFEYHSVIDHDVAIRCFQNYDGVIVAKLPFEPVAMIRGMLHGSLKGKDYTDCAMTGLYFLCNMAFRQTIKMILGTQPPRTGASFFPSLDEMEEKVDKVYGK